MIELMLGLVFLFLMVLPFMFGEDMLDTPLPSIGLILFALAYLGYFNNIFLPLPELLNKGLIASFAIVDSLFELFFGLGINDLGGGDLIIFFISLSITYTLLNYALGSLTMLSPRAREFITLAVLFVTIRTTTVGNKNLIFLIFTSLLDIILPSCGAQVAFTASPMKYLGIGIAVMMMGLMSIQLMKGKMGWIVLGVAIGLLVLSIFFSGNYYLCIYSWLVQLAAILFTINLILQAISLDWMKGIYDELRKARKKS